MFRTYYTCTMYKKANFNDAIMEFPKTDLGNPVIAYCQNVAIVSSSVII